MTFFSRFRRITSSGKFLPFIDGLRFIAIAPVILTHIFYFIVIKANYAETATSSWLWLPIKNGGHGVQIFFAISGFILALPFVSYYLGVSTKPVSLKSYFLRRLTRLEPPYIISMVFFFIVLIITHKYTFSNLFPHLVGSLLYVHNIIWGKGSDINTVAWSLEVEVQFYILAPVIFLIFKQKQLIRRAAILFVILLFACLNSYYNIYYRSLPGQIQFFLIGVLMADIYVSKKNDNLVAKLNHPLIFITSLLAILFIDYTSGFFNQVVFLAALLIMFLSSISPNLKNHFLKNNIVTFCGGMCYSIYLIHYPLISFVGGKLLAKFPISGLLPQFIVYCLIIIPIIFVCSVGFYLLFERPFMDKNWYKKKLTLSKDTI